MAGSISMLAMYRKIINLLRITNSEGFFDGKLPTDLTIYFERVDKVESVDKLPKILDDFSKNHVKNHTVIADLPNRPNCKIQLVRKIGKESWKVVPKEDLKAAKRTVKRILIALNSLQTIIKKGHKIPDMLAFEKKAEGRTYGYVFRNLRDPDGIKFTGVVILRFAPDFDNQAYSTNVEGSLTYEKLVKHITAEMEVNAGDLTIVNEVKLN